MTAAARVHQVLYYQAAPHLPPRDLSGLSMGIGLSMGMGLSIFMSTCTGHALIGLSCSCDNERPMNINALPLAGAPIVSCKAATAAAARNIPMHRDRHATRKPSDHHLYSFVQIRLVDGSC